MKYQRDISPPLPPEPALAPQRSSPPRSKTSRDSVIGDSSSQVSATSSRKARSRATSDARPIIHQHEPQPIRDAVDRAFDQSIDESPATAHLDPSFIAQVTEAVVKNLVNANIGVASSTHSSSSQYPPAPPSTSSQSVAFEATPQSPVFSDTSFQFSRTPPSPTQGNIKLRDSVQSISGEGFHAPPQATGSDLKSQFASVETAEESENEATNSRRSSKYATAIENDPGTGIRRPSQSTSRPSAVPPTTTSDSNEPTAVEKAWQPLFDKDGKPTPRCSQFLRGIALHLINEYEPKATIVITPAKLLRFLEENRIPDELYPWRTILGGSVSCGSISTIYRRLLCQHHLIQLTSQEPPNLPSLTPQGFESFMTCLIQAHPDIEYERLSQAVVHMPISNADNPKERFPKELSRRLLPAKASAQAEQRLIASMAHEPQIKLRNVASMPPPPPQAGPLPERQRMPYSRASHSNVFDDEDLSIPSAPIERERKPYVAREGGGKVHRDVDGSQHRAEEPPPRFNRHNSQSGSFSYTGTTPPELRAARRTRLSTGPGSQPPLSYNDPNVGRSGGRRSPPMSTAYARSDIGSGEPGQASHYHRMSDPTVDMDRRYDPRRTAASTNGFTNDDTSRSKPIPMRQSQPPNNFDPGYPPPMPPLSTSLPRSRQPPNASTSFEDRRKSAYSMPSNTGVPDNWNNFGEQPVHYPPPPRPGPNGLSGSAMNH